jgi:hypothetical protein
VAIRTPPFDAMVDFGSEQFTFPVKRGAPVPNRISSTVEWTP